MSRIRNLRVMAEEKRKRATRCAPPQLALHPLQVERQRRGDEPRAHGWPLRSASIGSRGRSRIIPRAASRAGSCRAAESRDDQTRNLGHDGPRQRNSRRDAQGQDRRAERFFPGGPSSARGQEIEDQDARGERFGASVSRRGVYGRRLVRLGAQLCDEHGTLLERDYARAWLPETLKPGATVDVPIEIVGAEDARQLLAEVRSGQRRDRLVREQRLADDLETAGSPIKQKIKRSGKCFSKALLIFCSSLLRFCFSWAPWAIVAKASCPASAIVMPDVMAQSVVSGFSRTLVLLART